MVDAGKRLSDAGCGSESQEPTPGMEDSRKMVLRGTAEQLQVDTAGSLRVAARWSTERTEKPGVYIQIDDVVVSGATPGAFDLQILAPPADVLDHESDGDYDYTSAELVLLDDDSLAEGWADAELLNESEVGRSQYIVYFVDRDIPASSRGHFGIGPVDAGFHLLERMPDETVLDSKGRPAGSIAIWEEAPLTTKVEIALGSDGSPAPGH